MFSRATAREMVGFLAAAAQTIVRPGQLAGILVEELRRRRVLLPSALVLEAVIRRSRQRAEALAHGVLTGGLDEAAQARLDGLLAVRPTGKLTWFGWLLERAAVAGGEQRRQAARPLGPRPILEH